MLRPTQKLLRHAQQNGYALGAFNVYNLEGVTAVIQAAEAEHSPVLLQILPKALTFGGVPLVELCLAAGRESTVPVAVHLDHSTCEKHIEFALRAGVQSVMADGSDLDYHDNIAFTRRMATRAHDHDATIEAELGKLSGTEDGLTVADFEARMTDPAQAAEFVDQTGIDMLAVCIGNMHGIYPTEPRLDFDRLARIRKAVDIPLVLHGASGLPEDAIRQSIARGVCKFNVNTEVRQAYSGTIRMMPASADLLDIMQAVVDAMRHVVVEKMQLFGSSGRVVSVTTRTQPDAVSP